ncbi:GNAT family N-acetyltransferase [Hoeflea sp.]|uniref:GNAT family N-acetyltransferase n=1 Tax=Hoeflea sp. TaxID=1940281 RepID=UPI003B01C7ED
MRIEIRHTEPEDAPDLHAILISPHVVEGTMRLPYMALATTQERLKPRAGRLQLTALADANVAGFAELLTETVSPRSTHAATLNMIVTRDDMRNKGICTALMNEITTLCDTVLGLRRISLLVWADNEQAIRLYERHGFEREGLLRDFVRGRDGYKDAIQMARIRSDNP